MSIRLLLAFTFAAATLTACSSKTVSSSKDAPASAAKSSHSDLPGSQAGEPLQDMDANRPPKEEKAADKMVEPERDVHCKKASDERWLQIEVMGDNGCKLWYTKDTGKKAVAWSSSSRTHCRTSRDKMVTRLTGDGFECKSE
jgi:hypothetical protein